MKTERYIGPITDAAKLYDQNLNGRDFLFIAVENSTGKYNLLEVRFTPANFMHLVGAKGIEMSPKEFYDACINGKLSARDFVLEYESHTRLKLDVINELMMLPTKAKMMGDFNGNGDYLFTDKLAGNVRGCLGFVLPAESKIYFPITVLKADIRQRVKAPHQILAVYGKDSSCALYEYKPLSVAKSLYGKTLIWPEEIAAKIAEDNEGQR